MPITLSLTPRRPALLADQATRLELLVRLGAEADAPAAALPATPRPALNLAIVLDRSGSMAGRPVEEAKRLAIRMAESLAPRDRAALVVYDHQVDVLVPAAPAGEANAFRAALAGINARGNTDLHAGWKAGARQIAPFATARCISRVLLLSDGRQNWGTTDAEEICARVARMAAAGVSTSTFGLGNGFNEALMSAMARAGQGSAYYGDTAPDLAEPFATELALVNALVARRVRLVLRPAAGCVLQVLGAAAEEEDGIVLPDLAEGAATWALVALTVPAAHRGTVLSAHATWQELRTGRDQRSETISLELPHLPAAAFAAVAEDEAVVARAAEVAAAGLLARARTAAYDGDWKKVERLSAKARTLAKASPWLAAVLAELQALAARRDTDRFAKEAHYSVQEMIVSRETLLRYEARSAKPAPFLRRKTRQGKAAGA